MCKIFLHLPLLLFSLNGFCQELNSDSSNVKKAKHDISFNYGIFTSNRTNSIPGIWDVEDVKFTNGIFITYKYSIIQKLSIGCSFGYERESMIIYDLSDNQIHTRNSDFFTTAIECEFKYINSEEIQLYSSLGIGITHIRSCNVDYAALNFNEFNFQIILLGFRAGFRFSPSIALGYGYKGIVNIGLSYQF